MFSYIQHMMYCKTVIVELSFVKFTLRLRQMRKAAKDDKEVARWNIS